MRGSLRHRKMLKVSFRRAIVIADNGVFWVGGVGLFRRDKKDDKKTLV